jgi:tetratricopeptide (TPR) repeat protein
VVAGCTALEEKQLVQLVEAEPEPRLTMLETIHEYAAERLVAAGEVDVRTRHADYFLRMVEAAEPELPSSPGELLDRLEIEHANVRAALAFLESTGDHTGVLRMVGAFWRFWYLHGHLGEGRRWLETALGHDPAPTLARAKALDGAAAMAINAGDVAASRARAEEALALHRHLGDDVGAAYAGFMLANALVKQDERERARELYESSIRDLRANGAVAWSLLAARHLAYLYEEMGERSRAEALHAANLEQARSSGNDRFVATSLSALAEYALADGRVPEALALAAESLELHRELGDLLDTAVDLALFTSALAREGHLELATCLAAALDAAGDDIGVRRDAVRARTRLVLSAARERLDDETYDEAWERGHASTLREAVAVALGSSAATPRL